MFHNVALSVESCSCMSLFDLLMMFVFQGPNALWSSARSTQRASLRTRRQRGSLLDTETLWLWVQWSRQVQHMTKSSSKFFILFFPHQRQCSFIYIIMYCKRRGVWQEWQIYIFISLFTSQVGTQWLQGALPRGVWKWQVSKNTPNKQEIRFSTVLP